ncbi:tetratricopeptide repeat protein [Micromonospora terminaliae]|uniref:Tetratricopeptide repeat protein n=1 Tax=Micromonospora terminaliae TaxID=1914461 RepID=A0AAJ2ZE40_9ACTN|nr:tetratricopeptide repeat protein [Micromonospora terminaliae]NES28450.1 tetratricopeptide repeat protein [Micromonospora terminaliae]QGL45819.1 tetratricopeptide repeat protein [Micromonospora terminaliae]
MTTPLTPVELAFALLREGRMGDAENLMTREVQATADRHGPGSPEWASAQCDLGNVLLNADQLDRAAECFRRAAAVPPRDHESRKDQLTYRLNLGLALRMAGRLDEAETELRQGVQERLAFYGREHAGYAFGLEPLADLLRQRGDLAGAREVVEEAVANLWRNGHERVASALALRAAIVHAGGTPEPLFVGLHQLPDEVVEQIGQVVTQLLDRDDPASKPLLTALVAALEERLGADHQATLNALSVLANLGRDLGDQAGRIDAIERVLASYDRQGRQEQALMAALGLAMAQDEAGDTEAGLRTYASAAVRAERIGRPELRSQVLRNWGLALKEAGRVGPAEQRLTEAVEQARRGADHDMVGRAGVALGLFLQHEGRLSEARTVLEEGLAVLDPVHPDAIVGRSHLGAVLDGRTCGCGDMPGTIADAFREFVLTRLPADLLDRLDVAIVDGDFKIEVGLRREPTEAELERLNQVFQTAHAEFRRRISEPHYAR